MEEDQAERVMKWIVLKLLFIECLLLSLNVEVKPMVYAELIEAMPDIADFFPNSKEIQELLDKTNV
jgi:hypothetical protein